MSLSIYWRNSVAGPVVTHGPDWDFVTRPTLATADEAIPEAKRYASAHDIPQRVWFDWRSRTWIITNASVTPLFAGDWCNTGGVYMPDGSTLSQKQYGALQEVVLS